MLAYRTFPTSLGPCALAFGERGVVATALPSHTEASTVRALVKLVKARGLPDGEPILAESPPAWVVEAMGRIASLLDGDDVDLRSIPLDTRGMSDFKMRIYDAARAVRRGARATYGELARGAGSPNAARAVGRAMATNPWPLLVPCHRVVSAQGDLHGFSAPGGLRTKAALLAIEARAGAPAGSTPDSSSSGSTRAAPRRARKQRTLPLFR